MAFEHFSTRTDEQSPLLTKEIMDEINKQAIFWSDDRMCHWFFDFQYEGLWVSAWNINNELTECCVDLFKG